MPRSTEALVEPDILRWARDTAGLSVDEAARSLQTRPDGCRHGRMAKNTRAWRSFAAWRRPTAACSATSICPDAPRTPRCLTISGGMPGEVAFRYSKALRYQLRQARQRRALALDLAAELDTEIPATYRAPAAQRDTEAPARSCGPTWRHARHATRVARPARELQWLAGGYRARRRSGFQVDGHRSQRNAGFFPSRPSAACHWGKSQGHPERPHVHAVA